MGRLRRSRPDPGRGSVDHEPVDPEPRLGGAPENGEAGVLRGTTIYLLDRRQPAARASASVQNHRSPRPGSIRVAS